MSHPLLNKNGRPAWNLAASRRPLEAILTEVPVIPAQSSTVEKNTQNGNLPKITPGSGEMNSQDRRMSALPRVAGYP